MSDIQRIDLNRPIDNGGITFGKPPTSKEGRNSSRPITSLTSTASNLLNEYKPNNFDRETLSFSTLYSLMSDGTLGLYQSNLPYPGLGNYTLKSTIDIGITPTNEFKQYTHRIFKYNDYIYVVYPNSNIKYLDNSFNVSEIDVNHRVDHIFKKNDFTIFTLIDNHIYEINLQNNASVYYGQLDSSIPYPCEDIQYDKNTNQFIVITSQNDTAYVINDQLSVVFSSDLNTNFDVAILPRPMYNNQNDTMNIYSVSITSPATFFDIVLDLSSLSVSVTEIPEYIESYSIDLFNTYTVSKNRTQGKTDIYNKNTLLGSINSSILDTQKILMIDTDTDIIIATNQQNQRNAYILSHLLKDKLSIAKDLD